MSTEPNGSCLRTSRVGAIIIPAYFWREHARDQEQKNKKSQMNANKNNNILLLFAFICVYLRDAHGCANAAGAVTAMDGGR